jgi:hypothetical protein
MVHGLVITIYYMFRPLYWPSSGLHYVLTYQETIEFVWCGQGRERNLVLQIVGRTECRNLGGVLTSVVVVVVVYLGASVCGLDTLGHLLCAITSCVYGVELVLIFVGLLVDCVAARRNS